MKTHDTSTNLLHAFSDPTRLNESHELLTKHANSDDHFAAHMAKYRHLIEAVGDGTDPNALASLAIHVHADVNPCFVLSADSEILLANQGAADCIQAQTGNQLGQLSLRACDKAAIRNVLVDEKISSTSRHILQVRNPAKSRSFALVLFPPVSAAGEPKNRMALLIDPAVDTGFIEQIATEFGLTKSEKSVVKQFMAGDNLEEIALARRRSPATVKTQFYAIFKKFGVKSQTELLQNLFALSNVSAVSQVTQDVIDHPFRREAAVLRPNNRMVEVILAGDMSGTPVVHIPTLLQRCFPAKTEAMLKEAGILVITIIQPGNGNSSLEPKGTCQRACSCGDIVAVLDQLGIEKALLFGTDSVLRTGVSIAEHIPDRVRHILVSSPTLPSKYEKQFTKPQTFYPLSRQLQAFGPDLRRVSLRLIWRTITTLRASGMLRIFMKGDKADLRVCLEPDTLAEIQAAFDCVIQAGFDRFAKFYGMTFDDWHNTIDDCVVPITIYEGPKHRMSDLDMMCSFHADYSEKINLVTCAASGTCLPYVRPDLMIEMIRSCHE